MDKYEDITHLFPEGAFDNFDVGISIHQKNPDIIRLEEEVDELKTRVEALTFLVKQYIISDQTLTPKQKANKKYYEKKKMIVNNINASDKQSDKK